MIIVYGDEVYTNFRSLNVPEDVTECASLTVIFIVSVLVYKYKYYLLVYLDNCAYKIVDKRIMVYLGQNSFETDED